MEKINDNGYKTPLYSGGNGNGKFHIWCMPSPMFLYSVAKTIEWNGLFQNGMCTTIIQKAAIALEPLTTHPDEWEEPSHK